MSGIEVATHVLNLRGGVHVEVCLSCDIPIPIRGRRFRMRFQARAQAESSHRAHSVPDEFSTIHGVGPIYYGGATRRESVFRLSLLRLSWPGKLAESNSDCRCFERLQRDLEGPTR